MINDGNYPAGFYFSLSFNGEDTSFQEVSGLSKELRVEEVVSGGENRFNYRLPKLATSQNLVLKRALVTNDSKLIKWCASSLDTGLNTPIEVHDVTIRLLGADNLVLSMWTFYKAYPVKYSVADFRSQDNTLVIESVELAYNYFPVSGSTVSPG
jgi:phage tail-like protein